MTVLALTTWLAMQGCAAPCAAGIAGNLWVESRLQPCIVSSRYVGMAQLAGPRKRRFLAWAGRQWCDATMQLKFMLQELEESGVRPRLWAARSPEQAAVVFARGYEQGAGTGARVSAARRLYQEIGGSK